MGPRNHVERSGVNTTLKSNALLIGPNIFTDIAPARRETKVTHELGRTLSGEGVKIDRSKLKR